MNTFNKISLIITSFFVVVAMPLCADAAAIATTPYVSTPSTLQMGPGPVVLCSAIGSTASYGQHDGYLPKNITILQNFLYQRGYLGVSATGYFGPLTLQAVKTFQEQYGLTADGIVGPLTRAKISAVACPTTTPVTAVPTITSITPTSGPSQTVVTITGTGFTDSNIVHFSIGGFSGLGASNNDTTISFTVPPYIGPYCKPNEACPMYVAVLTNGTYQVSVENDNGTSNSMPFTVTGNALALPN